MCWECLLVSFVGWYSDKQRLPYLPLIFEFTRNADKTIDTVALAMSTFFLFYFYLFIYFNTTKQNFVMILAEYKNFGIEWQWRFWNWGVRWVGNQKIALPGVGTLGTTKFTSNTHTSIWKSSISCCSYCFRIYIGNHLRNFVDWTLRSNHTLLRSNVSYFCYKNSLSELDQPALEEFKALKAKIY